MGQKFRTGDGPGQAMLMPADPRDWLPPGHLAWKVLDLAGELDLAGFGGYRGDGQGGRPYDPRMMATLLLYCYCRGRRSSREIEGATFDDVGARIICGGLHPDHSTVAEFFRRNAGAILALLPASVKACAAEGLVDLSLVAGDGTKLKANAAMAGNRTAGQLDAEIAELEAWIEADLRAWAQDFAGTGDGPFPPGGGNDDGSAGGGPAGGGKKKWEKKPARAGEMLRRRLAARARLDALRDEARAKDPGPGLAELTAVAAEKEAAVRKWEDKARARLEARAAAIAAGRKPRGAAPFPVDRNREVIAARRALAAARADLELARSGGRVPKKTRKRRTAAGAGTPAGAKAKRKRKTEADLKVNPADPSSRVMPLKKGGFDQLFNTQALATARSQVIIAILRHDSPADVRALLPLLAEARRVLRAAGISEPIRRALFDTGYASDANFTAGTPETLYVAVTREGRQAGRTDEGRNPGPLPSWQDMTARLDTPEGKKLYKQRAATIEPVFAQLTARLGRALSYRGSLADAELALWAASHNILKAITARTRQPARQARTATTAAAAPAAA
jgi:transposase